MFDQVIVPVDGSEESARAIRPASAVAHYLGIGMRVVTYHSPAEDGFERRRIVGHQARDCGDVLRSVEVEPMVRTVPEHLSNVLDEAESPLLVMSTRGHGYTASIVGSVANELLDRSHQPILLVGPECDVGRFRLHGPMIVATDASPLTQPAIGLAADLVETFDFEPWVVNVLDPATDAALAKARRGVGGDDVPADSAMVHRFAERLGHDAEFTALHSKKPGRAIADQANEIGAVLVTMATHARSGLRRLRLGSVTADVLTHVRCPVMAIAPAVEDD